MSKPSWDDAPDWAQWLAMDADGQWYWYESKPEWHFGTWETKAAHVSAGSSDSAIDSLEQRP
ncbi:hypothetical protein ACM9XA_03635 [Xanthomonas sacchari]